MTAPARPPHSPRDASHYTAFMRLGHVTDLHARHRLPGFAGKPGRLSRDMLAPDGGRLRECLARMKDLGCDAVAVTGDLLDAPTFLYDPIPGFEPDEPAFWAERAEQDYRLVKQILDKAGMPCLVLPGNHDSEPAMWRVFDPEDHEHTINGVRLLRFCDREHHIGAHGHTPRRFHPERTRWLDALADTSAPQVHLQHYVIAPTTGHRYPHNYAEHEEMTRRLAAAPHVRLALSGHDHNPPPPELHGRTLIATTTSYVEHPHAFRVFDIPADPGAPVTFEDHALDPDVPFRPAVFLDRDGTINDRAAYHFGPEKFDLIPGSADAIRRLNDAGFAVIVQTRQSCVGKGLVPYVIVRHVHDRMHRLLEAEGARVDAAGITAGADAEAVLPLWRDNRDAKPSPAMLLRAARDSNIDLERSWMVGDSTRDVEAGVRAGCRGVLVRTGHGREQEADTRDRFPEVSVTDDLAAAADLILEHPSRR